MSWLAALAKQPPPFPNKTTAPTAATTTPKPTAVHMEQLSVLSLIAFSGLLLLPFLFLMLALGRKPPSSPIATTTSTASTPEAARKSPAPGNPARPPPKRVKWVLHEFCFAALPSNARALLLRLLPAEVVALASTSSTNRAATLRAVAELNICGRAGDGDDANEEEGVGLLPLLAQLSPEALTTIRIKRAGVVGA